MYIYLLNNRNINNQLGLGRNTEKINHWPVKKTWSSLHRQLRESRLTLHWTAPCLPYCPLEEPRRSERCTRRWWRPQRPGTSLGPQTETEWTRTRCWSDWDSTAWPSGWAEENKETNESKLLNNDLLFMTLSSDLIRMWASEQKRLRTETGLRSVSSRQGSRNSSDTREHTDLGTAVPDRQSDIRLVETTR